MAAESFRAHLLHQFDQGRLGNLVKGLTDPAGQAQATQSDFFRGRQHRHIPPMTQLVHPLGEKEKEQEKD